MNYTVIAAFLTETDGDAAMFMDTYEARTANQAGLFCVSDLEKRGICSEDVSDLIVIKGEHTREKP